MRSSQKACTPECYRRSYQGTEEFNKKRREYHRDHLKLGKGVVGKKAASIITKRRKDVNADAKAAK